MENAEPFTFFDPPLCDRSNGINHPPVLKTPENSKTLWGDTASGMLQKWYILIEVDWNAENLKNFAPPPWSMAICPGGWAETNPECPWSFQAHHELSVCFKSCYQWSNIIDSMRPLAADVLVEQLDKAILGVCFVLMTYMVVTWLIFREKNKQRIVLVLSILMWLQTTIDLLGYVIYPNPDERYCENDAVPRHFGFNYCAISATLVHGIISPMFQLMIAAMALDVYFKVIANQKNKSHYWSYYTAGSFLFALGFKCIPVYIYLEAAGFDGVNSCDLTFYLRQPQSFLTPTPVELINPKFKLDLTQLLLINSVEHFAWVASVLLFLRIIVAVMASIKRVGSEDSSMTSALKQIRIVKTPVLMIFFFTIISFANIYVWDVYAIENWQYFGPGGKPMMKSFNDPQLASNWYRWRLPQLIPGSSRDERMFMAWANVTDLFMVRAHHTNENI